MSEKAEATLEETMAGENNEDVIYYWAPMDMDQTSNFWSMCDWLNAGRCRCFFKCSLSVSFMSNSRNRLKNCCLTHYMLLSVV